MLGSLMLYLKGMFQLSGFYCSSFAHRHQNLLIEEYILNHVWDPNIITVHSLIDLRILESSGGSPKVFMNRYLCRTTRETGKFPKVPPSYMGHDGAT